MRFKLLLMLVVLMVLAVSVSASSQPIFNITEIKNYTKGSLFLTGNNPDRLIQFNLTGSNTLEMIEAGGINTKGYSWSSLQESWIQNQTLLNGLELGTGVTQEYLMYGFDYLGNKTLIYRPNNGTPQEYQWDISTQKWKNYSQTPSFQAHTFQASGLGIINNFPITGRTAMIDIKDSIRGWQRINGVWSTNDSLASGLHTPYGQERYNYIFNLTKSNQPNLITAVGGSPKLFIWEWGGNSWRLLYNQTDNINIEDPATGYIQNYFGKSFVLFAGKNNTENLTYPLNISVSYKPQADNVSITPTPLNSGSATGHCLFNDTDGDSSTGTFLRWYLNNSLRNDANNSFTLLSGNVTQDTNITFSCRVNDTNLAGDWVNSSIITVGDQTAPTLSSANVTPATGTSTSNINISISCVDTSQISSVLVTTNKSNVHTNHTMNSLGNSFYQFIDTYADETYTIPFFYCQDTSTNLVIGTSSLSFTISTPTVSSGGGGGGGGTIVQQNITVINQTVSNCNQNKVCEKSNGEDAFGCPSDCKINANYFTCDDPTQNCIANLFDVKNKTLRFFTVVVIISIIIFFLPKGRKK